jgi:hypothetical protein
LTNDEIQQIVERLIDHPQFRQAVERAAERVARRVVAEQQKGAKK